MTNTLRQQISIMVSGLLRPLERVELIELIT